MPYCETGCPSGFMNVSDVAGCYKPVNCLNTWSAASEDCRTYHPQAHLAFINSAEEQTAINNMLDEFCRTYFSSKFYSFWLRQFCFLGALPIASLRTQRLNTVIDKCIVVGKLGIVHSCLFALRRCGNYVRRHSWGCYWDREGGLSGLRGVFLFSDQCIQFE